MSENETNIKQFPSRAKGEKPYLGHAKNMCEKIKAYLKASDEIIRTCFEDREDSPYLEVSEIKSGDPDFLLISAKIFQKSTDQNEDSLLGEIRIACSTENNMFGIGERKGKDVSNREKIAYSDSAFHHASDCLNKKIKAQLPEGCATEMEQFVMDQIASNSPLILAYLETLQDRPDITPT